MLEVGHGLCKQCAQSECLTNTVDSPNRQVGGEDVASIYWVVVNARYKGRFSSGKQGNSMPQQLLVFTNIELTYS